MNRFVPLLVALLLIPAYIVTVSALPMTVSSACEEADGLVRGATDKVGFCSEIGFDVSRSYYFGLIRLPVYRVGMNLDLLHRTIIPVFLLIGVAGAWWLGRDREEQETDHGYSYQP